ncbi:MAG TPA: hypothetical protein VGM10_29615 [Actinocrinis sp.]
MPTHSLIRRCAAVVDRLDIPGPFDIERLCAMLSDRRRAELGRPLVLVPYEFPPDAETGDLVTGLWIATADTDYVCFERRDEPLVRELTIGHELGHILAGHRAADAAVSIAGLFAGSGIEPGLIEHMFRRTGMYSRAEEEEAELIGTMLLERASRRAPARPEAAPHEVHALSVLGSALRPQPPGRPA